jgi:hypothetical protein
MTLAPTDLASNVVAADLTVMGRDLEAVFHKWII